MHPAATSIKQGCAGRLRRYHRAVQPTKDAIGDLPGFHRNLALLPEHDIGIHATHNGDGTGGVAFWDAKDLIRQVVDHYSPVALGDFRGS